jgi:hypothetical protein
MSFSSWLRHRSVSRKQRPVNRFRPTLEVLEDRAVPATLTVNTTLDVLGHDNGMLSLRQAIIDANATPKADTIILPAGTYTLTRAGAGEYACLTGDLDILVPLTINGAGAGSTVIDANGLDRAFDVHSCTVTLSGMAIRGGSVSTSGRGISPLLGEGGAILNSGTLTVTNCVVSGNYAIIGGGGIFNGGTLTVSNSVLSGNSAGKYGGGIYSYGLSGGTVTVSNSTLSGDHAVYGGAIWNDSYGAVTLQGCTLSGNSATYGGGIYDDGALTVSGSTLTHDVASSAGGGIYVSSSREPVTVKNSSSISSNSAPAGFGADVYNLGALYLDSTSMIGILDRNPAIPI